MNLRISNFWLFFAVIFCMASTLHSAEKTIYKPGISFNKSPNFMTFSDDGKLFAVLSYGNVKIKNIETDELVLMDTSNRIFKNTTIMAFVEEDSKLLFANTEKSGRLKFYFLDLKDGSYSEVDTGLDSIVKVYISNRTKIVAAVSKSNNIYILDFLSGKLIKRYFENENKFVYDINFSYDETRMAIATSDSILIFNTKDYSKLSAFQSYCFSGIRLFFSAKDKNIIKFDGTVFIYNSETGALIKNFYVSLRPTLWVFFTKEKYLLLMNNDSGNSQVWDIDSEQKISNFSSGSQLIALHPDTSVTVAAYGRSSIELRDYVSGSVLSPIFQNNSSINFNCSDQNLISSISHYVYDRNNFKLIRKIDGRIDYLFSLSCAYGYLSSDSLIIADLLTDALLDSFNLPKYKNFSISPNLSFIATIDDSNKLSVWDWNSKNLIYTLDSIHGVSFSNTGAYYRLYQGDTWAITIRDSKTGELLFVEPKNGYGFTPDGKYYYSSFKDSLTLWELPSGKLAKIFLAPNIDSNYYNFSKDSKYLIFQKLTFPTPTKLDFNIYNLETSKTDYSFEIDYYYTSGLYSYSDDLKYFLFGFEDGSSKLVETGFSTDVNENMFNESLRDFSISPNPAEEFIEITKPSEGWEPSEGYSNAVRIFNVFGETVMKSSEVLNNSQFSIHNSQLRIDVSGLPSGVYFVRVGDKVGKFLKI